MTLEEQLIMGVVLKTLNEDAFEDAIGSERPSPTNGSTGEIIIQQLPSIHEGSELGSPTQKKSCDDLFESNNNHLFNRYEESLPTVIIMPNIDDTRL